MASTNELGCRRQGSSNRVAPGSGVWRSLIFLGLVLGPGFSAGGRSVVPGAATGMPTCNVSFTPITHSLEQLGAASPGIAELRAPYVARLERNLNQSIIGFWYPRCLDRKNGGYAINFGPTGEPKGDGAKMIVTQARMVWLFAILARARQAADLGKDPGISRQPRRGDTQN